MRWDHVLEAVSSLAIEDAALQAIYGDTVRLAGTAPEAVPALEFMLIADGQAELWAPCTVQFDQFVGMTDEGAELLTRSERRLFELFHHDVPTIIKGIGMWAQYLDGETLATPDRDGKFGRAARFRFTPLRERYDAAAPS